MPHATVLLVERLGQLTGSVGPSLPEPRDPEGRPLLTETGRWGVRGVDLGACTEHDGRLFVFFGDSFDPPHADPICWSDDEAPLTRGGHLPSGPALDPPPGSTVEPGQARIWRRCSGCDAVVPDEARRGPCPNAEGGGISLDTVVDAAGRFVPFTVEGPIGPLGINETPTGAFSHSGRVYVFVWVGPRPAGPTAGSYLVSTSDPTTPAAYRLERAISPLRFDSCAYWQISPVVVDNAAHAGLPTTSGQGLVMMSHGFDVSLGADGIHLAWMPLGEGDPANAPLQYAALGEDGTLSWSAQESNGRSLFRQHGYSAVSLLWVEPASRWVLLYSKAGLADPGASLPDRRDGPIVARLGTSLADWSDEIPVFDPIRDQAVGRYLHRPGADELHRYPPGMDAPGWSYGAFQLERLTTWDEATRRLGLTYLLSTFAPYQVQLMRTTLHVA
jgi:hypothetical protein